MTTVDADLMAAHRARRSDGPLGKIRGQLAALGRGPRKRLGQHFLADVHVARRIVDVAVADGERVVEIGPGLGALTELLVERAAELWLIEVDADLAERLRHAYADRPQVHIVEADALRVDFAALLGQGPPALVVANLPYNIATAVLAKLLAQAGCFSRFVLMMQREVVERLMAEPGSSAYSALSVLTQFEAQVHTLLRVGPEAFVPRPKVESEVIRVEPRRQPPVEVGDPALLRQIVRTAFNQRRKQLANSLRPLIADPGPVLRELNIDPRRRPETLSLSEFAALANALGTLRQAAQST